MITQSGLLANQIAKSSTKKKKTIWAQKKDPATPYAGTAILGGQIVSKTKKPSIIPNCSWDEKKY